jgi:hypothetical protein
MKSIFGDKIFFLDERIAVNVRDVITRQGGVIATELPKHAVLDEHWCWLVTPHYLEENFEDPSKPRQCMVVLDAWVYMCIVKSKLVEISPFCISQPLNVAKRLKLAAKTAANATITVKAKLYTIEEDDELMCYANNPRNADLTQEDLWMNAERKGILSDRTANSMLRRFQTIKAKYTRNTTTTTGKHYDDKQDEILLAWAWCWRNMERPTDVKELRMWGAAEKYRVISGRTAKQMKARYDRVKPKFGGVDGALAIGKQKAESQAWRDKFTLKITEDIPDESNLD